VMGYHEHIWFHQYFLILSTGVQGHRTLQTNSSFSLRFKFFYFPWFVIFGNLRKLFSTICGSNIFIYKKKDTKLKICYLFWKKLMLARALIGNRQYFVMGYHEHIWFHQCQEDINRLYHVITEKDNTTKFEILLTFDPSPEILIFILSVLGFTWYLMYRIISLSRLTVEGKHFDLDILMGGDMECLQLVLGLGGCLCNYSCPWYRVHKNHKRGFTWYLMYRIISLSRLTYAPGIFPGILSKWNKLLISSWHWWNQICSW
jgi:hypothetical protein